MRLTRFATVGDPLPPWPAWVSAGHRRRVDPMTRMACAAVETALTGLSLPPDTAVVVGTAYGAVESTWRFANSIADFGDDGASPTPFTASVHNSTAGALGELLHLHGPCSTLSQGAHATTACLRWADLMLHAGRAPAVLMVLTDRHNAWSRPVVGALTDSPWPIGDGAIALLAEPGAGTGRELRWGVHAADLVIDAGAPDAHDEALLASAPTRIRAADRIGCWWPGCTLAALTETDWRSARAIQVRECENGIIDQCWLGPWR